MPDAFSNSFAIPVDDELAIEIEYDMQSGTPMPFVVRLMAHVEGRKVCVSRFDSAHSEKPPHRDVLGHRDNLLHTKFFMKRWTTGTRCIMLSWILRNMAKNTSKTTCGIKTARPDHQIVASVQGGKTDIARFIESLGGIRCGNRKELEVACWILRLILWKPSAPNQPVLFFQTKSSTEDRYRRAEVSSSQ
jgi:hypothetical protein